MKRSAPAGPCDGGGERRPRGGIRQRLARQNQRDEVRNKQSALATMLMELIAWGEISAQMGQRIAQCAYQDACALKNDDTNLGDLQVVSEIGASGRYPNKCYGDLMRKLPVEIKVPLAYKHNLPFKNPLDSLRQAFLLPHELFASIWQFYPATWRKFVMPCARRLRAFWESNRSHPVFPTHDVQHRGDYTERCIPISLHGDDVPITGIGKAWASLMTTFSWTSMLSTGETRDCQYFIFGCFEKLRESNVEDQSKDTLGVFFRILVWSLNWLYKGQWPDRDWQGRLQLVVERVWEGGWVATT